MAEAVVSIILQTLVDRMTSEVTSLFKGSKLKILLEKMYTTMTAVKALLDDAEEKQITHGAMKAWLDRLKDTVYDADDLLDEIAYKALRSNLEAASQIGPYQVRNLFSSRKIEAKLEDMLMRFEYLHEKDRFDWRRKEFIGENQFSSRVSTTSVLNYASVYGRDNDKEAIVNLLLSHDSNGSDLGVIPIVGMGGIGKTTLAQLLYNDQRVLEYFQLQAWVCVTSEFDLLRVAKGILEGFTGEPCYITELEMLLVRLREILMGKRFLLVLDDVWNDKYEDWQILLSPLRFGATGSRIIVTTRSQSVASVMGTAPVQHLRELSEDDCWSLFAQHAFFDGNFSSHPELEEIGRAIVRKCKGLPLSAKALGGLLRTKRVAVEWEAILMSNMWDLPVGGDVLQILKLSYNYLPSQLKQCFAYCAILPKGYEFQKEELILLWMAQGFLVLSKGNKEMKEVGDEYFHHLVSWSFFQQSSVNPSYYFMHDLMNELARFVAGDFYLSFEGGILYGSAAKARHFSYERTEEEIPGKFELIYEAQSLRTFFSMKESNGTLPRYINNEVINNLLLVFKRLRVLSLPGYDNIVGLSDSIGNMKHLRFLNISKTSIRKLPESVCRLYNLQTLILYGCKDFIELPANLARLINLCHLDIHGTKVQEMPPQMGKLTKLQKLTDFVIGKQSGSSIKELGMLHNLQEELCIWNLQNVLDAQEALEANLKGKKNLKELEMRWVGETEDLHHEGGVLEQLQPHMNVERLVIVGYRGKRFPDWVGDFYFCNIASLRLSGCKYCSSLPPLGQLARLEELSIAEFNGIMAVGPEIYGSSMDKEKSFASLKILRFERMALWHEWHSHADGENGAFSHLQELYISECPNLRKALPGHLKCLTTLEIEGCQKLLVDLLPRAPSIRKMLLKDNSRFLELQKFPSGPCWLKVDQFHSLDSILERLEQLCNLYSTLEEIHVSRCHSLTCLPLEYFPKLKRSDIYGCPNLESLYVSETVPEDSSSSPLGGYSNFPLLQELYIRECPKLTKALPGYLPSLATLEVEGCQQLRVASLPRAPAILSMKLKVDTCHVLLEKSKHEIRNWNSLKFLSLEMFLELKTLRIIACPILESLSSPGGPLGEFKFLNSVEIWGCPKLESFPKGGLPAPNLAVLSLRCCPNLKSLPERMNTLLPCLVNLQINDCSELVQFPEGGLPSKLKSLEIQSCKKLVARRVQWGLQDLPSLSRFVFGMCEDSESFPGSMHLPSTLNCLEVGYCQNLKSLEGLQHLSSLEELMIWNCPLLQTMLEEGLPTSLSSLSICNCPLLEQRCQRDTGEYWSKISHIRIKINYHQINPAKD